MSDSPSRRRLSPKARREQLIDAALVLAAGGDLTLVSVQEIAARAGVSEGLLYHYFPTKQALVLAAVTRAARSLATDLMAAASGGSPRAQIDAGLTAYLQHVQAQPTGWRALLAARSGEIGEVASAVEQQALALLFHLMGIDQPSPAIQIALSGWTAFERDACLAWLDQPEVGIEVMKAVLLATFDAALAAAAEHDEQARAVVLRLRE